MKVLVPLILALLVLAGCSSQGNPASHSATAASSTPAPGTPRQRDTSSASASTLSLDLRFSGRVAGRMAQAQPAGSFCGGCGAALDAAWFAVPVGLSQNTQNTQMA